MPKWRVHSAIGRGRPLKYQPRSVTVSCRHYIHTTSPRAQEILKDRAVEGPPKPLFSRAKRLQEATSSIENLYVHSAARENSTPGHSKSVPFKESQSYQPGVLAKPRYVGGVPLNKDVIEGTQRARSSDGGRFKMDPGRRQPFPRAGMTAGREAAQSVVDARSLGARPVGAQGSSLIRSVRIDAPGGERTGPSDRSLFQPQNPQGDYGARSQPLEAMNGFQRRSTRTPRAENAGQASQTSFSRGPIGSQAHTPRGEGRPPQTGRSRAGRSRDSRDSDEYEPRRRKRDDKGGFDRGKRSGPDQKLWTDEELQYLKEKATQVSAQSLEYEPAEINRGTFTGMGPATASDEWGMSEMLRERLLLAKKYLNREFIQWDSKEQQGDVMAVVEKLKATRRAKPTNGDEGKAKEATSASTDGHQQAQALMRKLIGGSYEKFKRSQEKDVLGHVERYVHRNDSYYPEDEKSILQKVRSILPTEQAPRTTRGVKKDVMA